MEWYSYLLAVLGGLSAGFINTLAGSGSLITLPILIFLGLPANIANGTNRLGILLQCIVSVVTFRNRGELKLSGTSLLIFPSIAGALVGAFIAVDIDDTTMRLTIGVVMSIMFFLILFNGKKWLRERSEPAHPNKALTMVVFFFIGVYGGFLQAGVGIFLLAAMVLLVNYSLSHANAIKNLIVLCFTIPAFVVFMVHDQIDWWLGGVMASGQVTGAWLAARFAVGHKKASVWVRNLMIAVILISIAELFNLRELLFPHG